MKKLVAIDCAREPMIGIPEAAAILEMSQSTVRRMASEDQVPVVAFPYGIHGKRIYKFRASELEAWMKSLRRGPHMEDGFAQSGVGLRDVG
jgi:predicted DNA-binding transcriptional regulator AlpA